MKKILLSNFFLFCIAICVCFGYFIGRDIERDFLNLYVGKMTLLPFRYVFLCLIILISNLIFNLFSNSVIIVRNKTYFNSFMNMIKYEVFYFILIYVLLNIPIFIINSKCFFNNLNSILLIILNSTLISILISSIIKLIDIKFKNRVFSSCLFLITFSIVDLLLDHFNFYIFINNIFDLSYIFVLPILYNNYIIIAILLFLAICMITSLTINFSFKKDYFLRNENK